MILGPIVFYMLVFAEGVSAGQAAVAGRRFLRECPAAVELRQGKKFSELRAASQTWIDLQAFQVARVHAMRNA